MAVQLVRGKPGSGTPARNVVGSRPNGTGQIRELRKTLIDAEDMTFQVRSTEDLETETLADHIRKHGQTCPILVQHTRQKYRIISGFRRFDAVIRRLGRPTIKAIAYDISDDAAFDLAIGDNLQRKDLSAYEKVVLATRLKEARNLTVEEIAERFTQNGHQTAGRRIIELYLSIGKQSVLLEALKNGALELCTAIELARAENAFPATELPRLVAAITAHDLSVRQAAAFVRTVNERAKDGPQGMSRAIAALARARASSPREGKPRPPFVPVHVRVHEKRQAWDMVVRFRPTEPQWRTREGVQTALEMLEKKTASLRAWLERL